MTTKLLTQNYKKFNVLDSYYSNELIAPITLDKYKNLYCFLSGIEPWSIESNPPNIILSDRFIKQTHKNIFILKKITVADISIVIERIDWTNGIRYNRYDSEINILESDSFGHLINKFYVRNSLDEVFKCIWNGEDYLNPSGKPSTISPSSGMGLNFNNIITTSDGYAWQFLYTIDPALKLKFFDPSWMPINLPFNYKTDISSSSIGFGEIDNINITNPGSNYVNDATGVSTIITISGDGIGAEAKALVSGNKIVDIIISAKGSGYTYANCTISTSGYYTGSGATAIVSVSPINGSGSNLLTELGAKTSLITCSFAGSENNNISTNIDYRQIGLISNPELVSGGFANSTIYSTATIIYVSIGSEFIKDEKVLQGGNLNPTFSGDVLDYDPVNHILFVINTINNPILYQNISGQTSGAYAQILHTQTSDISPFSGDILYIENIQPVTRTSTSSEQFR